MADAAPGIADAALFTAPATTPSLVGVSASRVVPAVECAGEPKGGDGERYAGGASSGLC